MIMRTTVAVIVVVLVIYAAPLVAAIIGFPLTGNLWSLLKLLVAGAAVLYIIRGGPVPPIKL